MDAQDRIGLLLDTFTLTKSGHISSPHAVLEVINAFSKEANHNAWGAISKVLKGDGLAPSDSLNRYFQNLPAELYEGFKSFVGSLFSSQLKELGWFHKPGDDDSVKERRGVLISLAGTFLGGDKAIVEE